MVLDRVIACRQVTACCHPSVDSTLDGVTLSAVVRFLEKVKLPRTLPEPVVRHDDGVRRAQRR
jgi:hypothetical protein